ncbi:fasciclin domain-containing protein [Mucilaginibacter myungsuensis]|uniref:Fasciclin domain-containing protein n=1 Tax=Mucilaginibacter myungsuensis TaxID=649104 RepID=A0A929PYY1_9SPHI|nr:fasciclin domain-containing protein [Mucilaginibacter myungsuensis]MBE9664639.1 fasciclin domain-containing protein [Mucilaginibacter myungsuensis]MDN3601470.1 fasciclin domain-containing protein [Mucilaginibacter myungsuensis]
MKRTILFSKYIVAILFAAILAVGCKKESGFHNIPLVVTNTNADTYNYLKSKPGVYDSLLFLIDRFGLQKTLTDSTVTLFAPSNASFQLAIANLNSARRAQGKGAVYLKDIANGRAGYPAGVARNKAIRDSAHLDTMISRYIIKNKYVSTDFAIGDGQTIRSVRGNYPMHGLRIFADAEGFQGGGVEIIQFSNTKRSLFVQRWEKATTTSVNIGTKNGIVHLLRPDHVFGFQEFISRLTLIPPPPSIFNVVTDNFFPLWNDTNEFDGRVSSGETFAKARDNSVLTKFICNFNVNSNQTQMYWYPRKVDEVTKLLVSDPRIVNSYTMTTANDSKLYRERDPKAFRLEGTLDANPANAKTAAWVVLDTRQDQEWTTNYQQKIFDFTNTRAYAGYRIIILQLGGAGNGTLFQISEWTMNYRTE